MPQRNPNQQKPRIFTLEEARQLVPWLMEASREAEARVFEIQQKAKDTRGAQTRSQRIIQYWAETVTKLGAEPKQPFTVDFDSGKDYFCWEYPEEDIYFRHDYHLGYAGRHRIEDSE